MNIIFFLHSFSIGGAERRCATVANSFAQRGDHVIAVLLDSPDILFDLDKRVQVFYLPEGGEEVLLNRGATSRFKNGSIVKIATPEKEKLRTDKNAYTDEMFDDLIKTYSNRIRDFIKKFPDYIVVSWVSLYSVACAMALADLPNKFVFVECNAPDAEFDAQHYFNALKRTYYPRANAAVFQTENEKAFYDYLERTKKYVIPNPVADLGIPRYTATRKKAIVTYCRLRKAKRLPLLIDAFAIFYESFPEYQLHIFGEGNEKTELVEYINKKNLRHAVMIKDFDINIHRKVHDYMMFVSSSRFEGMSNSMLEAMSIGLPVVCTDCYGGGARAVIKDGENGLLVPIENADALAQGMKRIAGNPSLANRLSENAVKIKDTLAKDKICQLWHNAFNEISDM